jgi:RimJ/RimL family protein N-acetyltransferase
VGTAVNPDNDVFLSKFYVRQSARGCGVGRAMLNRILAFARAHDAGRIWLSCNKHNAISLAAYEKLGFNITGDVVTDIGGGFVMDDFVLEMKLGTNGKEGKQLDIR